MKKSLFFLLGMALASQAFAWGDLGHSAVGYIAEKNLTPEGQKFIYSILGAEPMAVSAIWPDHVRDDNRFAGFAPYHFFEIPNGMNYGTLPLERRAAKSADTIIDKGPELVLINKSARSLNIPQKQIIMRYLIHVVGDVHQPLHVGNGLDLGANLCTVKFPDAETGKLSKTNLHGVWDDSIISHIQKDLVDRANQAKKPIKYFTYRNLAEAIIEESKTNGLLNESKQLIEKTSKPDWYTESQALHSEVYFNPELAPGDRTYCKVINLATGKIEDGKFDADKIPEVSNDYIAKAIPIIKRRILLGGLRLAKEINRLAKMRGDGAWSAEKEAEFFSKVMPESQNGRNPSSTKKEAKSALEFHDWCHDDHTN
jgi:hypothetical protein